jgi:hypothetical protein
MTDRILELAVAANGLAIFENGGEASASRFTSSKGEAGDNPERAGARFSERLQEAASRHRNGCRGQMNKP